MTTIRLTGQLICENANEVAVVMEFLATHIALTRAEPGCISFEVEQSPNPLIWAVAELFQDAESFAIHQARVKVSEWGRATAGIERNYTVIGL